jgi:hypothetical protein
MFVLGHTGISVGAVHLADRRADLRWVPFFALLPDLVDKPVAWLFPGFANGWTHSIGHSLLGFAVFSLGAAIALRRRAWIAILPYALHFVLDCMWTSDNATSLFWPFLGVELPPHVGYPHWWSRFEEPWQLGGEIVGLSILVALFVRGRLWLPDERRRALATGVLDPRGTPAGGMAPVRDGSYNH